MHPMIGMHDMPMHLLKSHSCVAWFVCTLTESLGSSEEIPKLTYWDLDQQVRVDATLHYKYYAKALMSQVT